MLFFFTYARIYACINVPIQTHDFLPIIPLQNSPTFVCLRPTFENDWAQERIRVPPCRAIVPVPVMLFVDVPGTSISARA